MKLSNPLSLILMAAASSDVSGSKSGKGSARLATGEDYEWVLGRYTKCQYTGIRLRDGEPAGTRSSFECDHALVIESLGDDQNGLTYQATFENPGRGVRYIYEGVGSYNPHYSGEITFYSDFSEELVDGAWVIDDDAQLSDVSTFRVSQLDGDCSSVVVDIYQNGQRQRNDAFQGERIGTYYLTDVDSE